MVTGGVYLNKKQGKVEKRIMKILLKEGTQFYHPETGEAITTKEFLAIALSEKQANMEAFLKKLKKKTKWRKKS